MARVVRRELVIRMMEMILIALILMMVVMEMVVMVEMVMEMMVVMVTEMEEMMEMRVMMTMMHCWLKGGPRRSTMICRATPTTTPSFSPLYAATTPGAPCSTGWCIGPTPTTPASERQRCTSAKGVGYATSTVLSLHGSHVQPPSGMLLDRRWWSIATATSTTSNGRRIVIFPVIGAANPPTTSPHHLWRRTIGLDLP